MAVTEAYTGTATIGTTEFSLPNNSTTLTPITADGFYQVWIDFANITAADEYEIRIYEKVISGGVQRAIAMPRVQGVQSAPTVFPGLIFMHGWDITVKKIGGTDRSISWSIRAA